ncbi:MAG: endonuclease/exonuclease/phosphatase family protein [Breznakibacter sp.]
MPLFRNIPRHILAIFTVGWAIMLLASALTAYVSPKYLHALAFAGFVFPVLWLLNWVLAVVNLLLRKWRHFAVALGVTLLTWSQWNNVYQTNLSAGQIQDKKPKGAITVMSFNTRMFDYYSWTGRPNVIDEVLDFVRKENPDIVCFQEFFSYDNRMAYADHRIVSRLNGYKYRHIEYNVIGKNGKKFGQATFSKFPIVGQRQITFNNTSNFSIQTDVAVEGKTIRVFNNHLESVRLKAKHYNFIDSINLKSDEERKAGLQEIVFKLNHALAQRAEQAETIARHIANSPYPVIVCGDFNDTPVSYVYHTMRGDLKDAFKEAGRGIGGTYNGKLPSFRIDFIFHDPSFSTTRFQTFKKNFSDHYPILAEIVLDPASE